MISVIIPYRNAGKWLGRCERSLQQDGDFEILFIDDNSTDGAKPESFNVIQNEHEPGVSGARNTGLDHAAGEWVTFLDADDEFLPNAYDKFMHMLETEALIHQSNHLRYYVSAGSGMRRWDNKEGIYKLKSLPLVWYGVWNKLYNRDLVQGIRFKEGMQYGEDELFNLECLKVAREIHHTSDVIVKHNIDNMQSLSHVRTRADLIRQCKELEDYIVTCDDQEIRAVTFDTLLKHMSQGWFRKAIVNE